MDGNWNIITEILLVISYTTSYCTKTLFVFWFIFKEVESLVVFLVYIHTTFIQKFSVSFQE